MLIKETSKKIINILPSCYEQNRVLAIFFTIKTLEKEMVNFSRSKVPNTICQFILKEKI